MWKRIEAYALLWNSRKHKGIIKVVLADGTEHKIKVKSSSEFDAMGNILRYEKPVNYNTESGAIASGWEPMKEDDVVTPRT